MGLGHWSRQQLLELTSGHTVGIRDEHVEHLPLPPWLAEVALDELPADLVELVEQVHVDDRAVVIERCRQSLTAPGELVTMPGRWSAAGTEAGSHERVQVRFLNLLDQAEVGALLLVVEHSGVMVDDPSDNLAEPPTPTDWMITEADLTGVIVRVEGNCHALLGYEPEEIIGHFGAEFTTSDNALGAIRMMRDMREDPTVTRTNRRQWIRRDGTRVWLESSYARRANPLPGEGDLLVVSWDITEKLKAERALEDSQRQLRQMVDNLQALADEVPAAVFHCRAEGTVTFHNARWSRLVDEHNITRIHDLFNPEARAEVSRTMAELGRAGSGQAETRELPGTDGTTVWRLTLRALGHDDGPRYMGALEDVTATARLRDQASHDPLTRLLNRAAIEAQISSALATAPETTTVMFIDLDRFKQVNDTWGHEAGDTVLVEVGRRLQESIRPTDAAGRWGGDEFLLLLRGDPSLVTEQVSDRVAAALQEPVAVDGGSWVPAASIGVVAAEPDQDLETLVRRADRAMFERKRAGYHQPDP